MKADWNKSDYYYLSYCFAGIKWHDNHLSLRGLFKICLGVMFSDIWFILSSIITDKRLPSVAGDAGCWCLFKGTEDSTLLCFLNLVAAAEHHVLLISKLIWNEGDCLKIVSRWLTLNTDWRKVEMKECCVCRFLRWACAKPLMLFVKHWLTTLSSSYQSTAYCWHSVLILLIKHY